MKPRASAPASTATHVSPALVMPQILTRVTLSTRLAGLLACGSSAPSQLELPSALASPGFSPAARRPPLSSNFHQHSPRRGFTQPSPLCSAIQLEFPHLRNWLNSRLAA